MNYQDFDFRKNNAMMKLCLIKRFINENDYHYNIVIRKVTDKNVKSNFKKDLIKPKIIFQDYITRKLCFNKLNDVRKQILDKIDLNNIDSNTFLTMRKIVIELCKKNYNSNENINIRKNKRNFEEFSDNKLDIKEVKKQKILDKMKKLKDKLEYFVKNQKEFKLNEEDQLCYVMNINMIFNYNKNKFSNMINSPD